MRKVIAFYLEASGDSSNTKPQLVLVILTCFAGGIANTVLLAMVTHLLSSGSGFRWSFAAWLLVLGAVVGIVRGATQYLLTRLTVQTLVRLRLGLCSLIAAAPLATLERLGNAKLTASFTETMPTITHALIQLPNLVMYAIVIAGCFIYMAWLSWTSVLVIALALCGAVVVYRKLDGLARAEFGKAHGFYMTVLQGFSGLLNGMKELKLHRPRREAHLKENLEAPIRSLAEHRTHSSLLYGLAEGWSVLSMFLTVVVILVVTRGERPGIAMGFVLTLLYLTPPVQGILAALPAFSNAQFAIDSLRAVRQELAKASDIAVATPLPTTAWSTIRLENIRHTYENPEGESGFHLGPVDLTIEAGEVVFVTGGNGSGKTTLVKILAGLYRPDGGRILVDGLPVAEADQDSHRQHFSAVFADFHLFEKLLGLTTLDEEATEYLRHLRLDHKVKVEAGRLSTIRLSQGQKKRLALLTAYLEGRSIYLFDEWAADQDPDFREYFYRDVIPGLKARGKTVIVVTHDERYFHLADRLIKLEFGRVVSDDVAAVGELDLHLQAVGKGA